MVQESLVAENYAAQSTTSSASKLNKRGSPSSQPPNAQFNHNDNDQSSVNNDTVNTEAVKRDTHKFVYAVYATFTPAVQGSGGNTIDMPMSSCIVKNAAVCCNVQKPNAGDDIKLNEGENCLGLNKAPSAGDLAKT